MQQAYDFPTVILAAFVALVAVGFFGFLGLGVYHDYVRWKNKSRKGVHFAFPEFPERPGAIEEGVLSDGGDETGGKSKEDHPLTAAK